MTRRRNARRARGPRGSRSDGGAMAAKISRVPFHRFSQGTLSGVTGNLTYPVNPSTVQLGALSSVGDQFDLFRVSELEYRLHPLDPTEKDQCLAFVPDVDVQTTSAQQLSESPIATVISNFSGVPSSWAKVPRSQLKGMLDWYKCTPDAGAAEFESQGVIFLSGGLGDTVRWEVRGVMDFKNPVSTAVMMERAIQRAVSDGLVVRIPQPTPRSGVKSPPVATPVRRVAGPTTPGEGGD